VAKHRDQCLNFLKVERKFRTREHSRIFVDDLVRQAGPQQTLMDGKDDQRFVA